MSIRITTLGRVAIHRDGQELTDLPGQPLRCAVLVYLAIEGEATRDAVMSMFWPRRKAARARHSLNQTVYQLRSVLGREAIESHGELLRVGGNVTVDGSEFEREAAREHPATALALYQGSFLAGDPLAAGKAFGRWVDRQRDHISRLHRSLRRAHIEGLLDADDHAGALVSAREWVQVAPDDDEAQARLEELSRHPAPPTPVPDKAAAPAVAVPGTAGAGRAVRLWLAFVLMAVVVALIVIVGVRGPAAGGEDPQGPRVGVVPFEGIGTPPDSSASIQAVFASALEWPGSWQAVDAPKVIPPDGDDENGAESLRRARERGLRYFLTGQVGAGPGAPGLSVSVWEVETGERVFQGRADAGEDPEDAAARLAYELVSHLADREGAALPIPLTVLHGTDSPTALGHFLRGRQYMGRGAMAAARDAFLRATTADPAFGHAWFRAGFTQAGASHPAMSGIVLEGLGHQESMTPRARRLLEGLRWYAHRQADSAIATFRTLVHDEPRDPDAWFGLAVSLHHLGAAVGHPPDSARMAFERLMALDSGYAAVHSHAFDLALAAGDHDAAAALIGHAREAAAGPEGPMIAREVVLTMVAGTADERAAALQSMRWQDRSIIAEAVRVAIRSGADLALVDELGAILQESIRTPSDRAAGDRYRFIARAGRGDYMAALDAWTGAALPGRRSDHTDTPDPLLTLGRLLGIPVPGDGRPEPPDGIAGAAAPEPDFSPRMGDPRRVAFRAAAASTAARGDSLAVQQLLAAIRGAAPAADPTDPMPAAIQAALQARLALLAADTTIAIKVLRDAVARPAWPHIQSRPLTCMAPQRLLLTRILAARGEEEATRWARTFGPSGCLADPLFFQSLPAATPTTPD